MLQNISLNRYDILKVVFRFVIISVFCIFTSAAMLYVLAIIVSKVNISFDVLYPATAVVLGFSAAINGFVLSRWFKENGMLWGIFAALITVAVLTLISLYYASCAISVTYLTKASIIILSGAAGGIIGVNTN